MTGFGGNVQTMRTGDEPEFDAGNRGVVRVGMAGKTKTCEIDKLRPSAGSWRDTFSRQIKINQ